MNLLENMENIFEFVEWLGALLKSGLVCCCRVAWRVIVGSPPVATAAADR